MEMNWFCERSVKIIMIIKSEYHPRNQKLKPDLLWWVCVLAHGLFFRVLIDDKKTQHHLLVDNYSYQVLAVDFSADSESCDVKYMKDIIIII